MSEKSTKIEKDTKSDTSKKTTSTTTKKVEKKVAKDNAGKNKKKRKPNWILWTGLAVIIIPCLVLLYIIVGTKESAGVPVTNDRFTNELDPAITEEDLNWLKENLVFDGVESINVNLISATLRININTNDDSNSNVISAISESAYNKVMERLPQDKYFMNYEVDGKKIKMYDIEVNVYNVIPNEETTVEQIYIVKSKSGASEAPRTDVLSSPKEAGVADGLLNPDIQAPQEEAATGEN